MKKSIFEKILFNITRYSAAILWAMLLVFFSYWELVFNLLDANPIGFNEKLIELQKSDNMIFANMGILIFLMLDKFFVKKFFNIDSKNCYLWLIFSFITIILLNFFAKWIFEGKIMLPIGMYFWCLFCLFLLFLTVYKAESFKIKHSSKELNTSHL